MMKTTETVERAQVASGVGAQGAWGDRLVARLPIGVRGLVGSGTPIGQRLRAMAPALLALVLLLLALRAYYVRWGYQGLLGGMRPQVAYMDLGTDFASRIGKQHLAYPVSGYDGQFSFYTALNPGYLFDCATPGLACPYDDPPERFERILFPMTARLLGLGSEHLIPYAMLLINIVAILVTVVLIGRMAVEAGASRWLGLAAGLSAGMVVGTLRDLNDPYATMWIVVAVYLLRRNRPLWAAAAVAAAVLTREQLVLLLPFLFVPLLVQRRWGTLALAAVIAGGPFLAWQGVLYATYGRIALLHSAASASIVPVPFAGLWLNRHAGDFGPIVLTVVVPLLVAVVIALTKLWREGPRSLLHDPLPGMVLLYAVLISLTSLYQWQDMWAPTRLSSPAIVLAAIVATKVPPSLRTIYGTLLVLGVLSPLLTAVTLY